MFPQTELDNYKLQVELLQEKLKRSEENRKQLEDKFDNIMRKKSEQEKAMKTKSKVKYQQFLEEQRERNERNKNLVKLLERVDHQATALAARSERLKMMKLQYEIYFAKLLQAQQHPTRSIQSSPRHYSVIPLNHIITNANLPIGIQDICQSSSNLSKSSPTTIPESWGIIPNNTNTITGSGGGGGVGSGGTSSNLPYRFPGNMDYFNGQILLSQEPLHQRQVNLKSTFGDSMVPPHGYPGQIGTFADIRRNQIEFQHYIPSSDLNMATAAAYMDGVSPSLVRNIRQDNHNRNLNEMQNFEQMNSEINDFHGRIIYNGYPIRQVDIQHHHPLYQMPTSDKLPNIKQDDIRERMLAEVNENDNKTDALEKHDEKSQSMNIAQRDITPMDEAQQKTDESKENWIGSTEKSMKMMQDLFAADKLLKNSNTINVDRSRTPVMWNFGGRIDPQDTNYPIQLGKKEKLSMEKIENAIYGERISPISRKKETTLDIVHPLSPERQSLLENLDMRNESSLKQSSVDGRENDWHEEKADLSEKEEKVVKGEDETTAITAKVDSKPSTPVSETSPNVSSELSSNQQYPEGYSQNYEGSYYTEQSGQQEQNSTTGENLATTEQSQSLATENPQATTNDSQGTHSADQYQDYNQYQDYPQGQDYNNYQNEQYQGDYAQQGYDPNAAYSYNYDQQATGETYQQQGSENYQQPDGTYQQEDGSYQDPNQYASSDYNAESYPTDYSSGEYGAQDGGATNAEDDQEQDVILPMPIPPAVMPPSILSTEKSPDEKRKKRRIKWGDDDEGGALSTAAPAHSPIPILDSDLDSNPEQISDSVTDSVPDADYAPVTDSVPDIAQDLASALDAIPLSEESPPATAETTGESDYQ